MQPGQTIKPGETPDNTTNEQAQSPAPELTPEIPPQTEQPDSPPTEQPPTWQYSGDDITDSVTQHAVPTVTWTASEFVDHDKRADWFLALAIFAVIGTAIIYFITRDWFTTGAVLIAVTLFGITAGRKPNTLTYNLDAKGIQVGSKLYEYGRFKSFSVIPEGALNSIHLTPLGRISPPLSIYYPPEQEEQIVSTLANYLPHEDRSHDPVDRLMRRIRF